MAYVSTIRCSKCGKLSQECRSASDYSSVCSACTKESKDRSEREWKASREGLTLEERIRDLENFMYHHGTHYYGPTVFG